MTTVDHLDPLFEFLWNRIPGIGSVFHKNLLEWLTDENIEYKHLSGTGSYIKFEITEEDYIILKMKYL